MSKTNSKNNRSEATNQANQEAQIVKLVLTDQRVTAEKILEPGEEFVVGKLAGGIDVDTLKKAWGCKQLELVVQ